MVVPGIPDPHHIVDDFSLFRNSGDPHHIVDDFHYSGIQDPHHIVDE